MTARSIDKILSRLDIDNLSSLYLREGRKKESWEIVHAVINNDTLHARVRMTSWFISATDFDGFHLPFLTALEFLSQFNIIYMHVWAGLSEKNRECWLIESSIKCLEVIRDPENIDVVMHVDRIKQVNNKILITTSASISDGKGLYEVKLKGFMS